MSHFRTPMPFVLMGIRKHNLSLHFITKLGNNKSFYLWYHLTNLKVHQDDYYDLNSLFRAISFGGISLILGDTFAQVVYFLKNCFYSFNYGFFNFCLTNDFLKWKTLIMFTNAPSFSSRVESGFRQPFVALNMCLFFTLKNVFWSTNGLTSTFYVRAFAT